MVGLDFKSEASVVHVQPGARQVVCKTGKNPTQRCTATLAATSAAADRGGCEVLYDDSTERPHQWEASPASRQAEPGSSPYCIVVPQCQT